MLLRTLSILLCGTDASDPDDGTYFAIVSVSCFTAGTDADEICRVRMKACVSSRGFDEGGVLAAYFANTADASCATATKVCVSAGLTALFNA